MYDIYYKERLRRRKLSETAEKYFIENTIFFISLAHTRNKHVKTCFIRYMKCNSFLKKNRNQISFTCSFFCKITY